MDLVTPKDEPVRNQIKTDATRGRRRKRNICLCALGFILLFIILLFVILAFIVFKPKHAVTKVNSIDLKGLKASIDILRTRVNLNVTLNMNLSVKNPNKVEFKYGNGSALVFYRGELVAEAGIPAGKMSPGQTIGMNLNLTVLADRLLSNSNVYSDVISGTLPLSTYTRVSGRVTILKLFKHHLVTTTTCDLSINVLNQAVATSECKYKTKL